MIFSAGLLEPNSTRLEWIKRCEWNKLSPEIKRDLDIALLTPGFSHRWWARALGCSRNHVLNYRKTIDPSLRDEAIQNWNSITRADCLSLTKRWGYKPIPVLVQMVSDVRAGMTRLEAQRTYGISHYCVEHSLNRPLLSDRTMPDWFRSLIPAT